MFCIFYQYIQSLKIFAFSIVYICQYKYLPFSKILKCKCQLYRNIDYNLHQKNKNKSKNKICIPITFNDLMSNCNPNTPDTNCKSVFLIEKPDF